MADVEVELQGGVKIKMPEEQAEVYKAARTKDKTERDSMASQLGAEKAERDVATKKAEKAEADRQAAEAMKAGELEKARELLTKEHRAKEAKYHARLRQDGLRSEITRNPEVIPSAVDDLVAQLENRVTFDPDANALVVIDAAGQPIKDQSTGKPLGADALVKDFLSTRPHFKKSSVPEGTGAHKTALPPKGSVMTGDEIAKMSGMDRARFFADGGKQVG